VLFEGCQYFYITAGQFNPNFFWMTDDPTPYQTKILSNKGAEEAPPYTHLKYGIFEDHQITPFIQASHFWEI
jgi:hypothetical protein